MFTELQHSELSTHYSTHVFDLIEGIFGHIRLCGGRSPQQERVFGSKSKTINVHLFSDTSF